MNDNVYIHQHLTRRLRRIVVIFLLLLLVSSVGYMLLEGYSPLDAAYMTAITLTTVGFGEVRPLSIAGHVFSIVRGCDRQLVDWAPEAQLSADDGLIVLGTIETLGALARLAGDGRLWKAPDGP